MNAKNVNFESHFEFCGAHFAEEPDLVESQFESKHP